MSILRVRKSENTHRRGRKRYVCHLLGWPTQTTYFFIVLRNKTQRSLVVVGYTPPCNSNNNNNSTKRHSACFELPQQFSRVSLQITFDSMQLAVNSQRFVYTESALVGCFFFSAKSTKQQQQQTTPKNFLFFTSLGVLLFFVRFYRIEVSKNTLFSMWPVFMRTHILHTSIK